MQIHVAPWQCGWSGRTCDMSPIQFLTVPFNFFALFFGSCQACTSGLILTIHTSYNVFPHKEVPFQGWKLHTSTRISDNFIAHKKWWRSPRSWLATLELSCASSSTVSSSSATRRRPLTCSCSMCRDSACKWWTKAVHWQYRWSAIFTFNNAGLGRPVVCYKNIYLTSIFHIMPYLVSVFNTTLTHKTWWKASCKKSMLVWEGLRVQQRINKGWCRWEAANKIQLMAVGKNKRQIKNGISPWKKDGTVSEDWAKNYTEVEENYNLRVSIP